MINYGRHGTLSHSLSDLMCVGVGVGAGACACVCVLKCLLIKLCE